MIKELHKVLIDPRLNLKEPFTKDGKMWKSIIENGVISPIYYIPYRIDKWSNIIYILTTSEPLFAHEVYRRIKKKLEDSRYKHPHLLHVKEIE